MQLSMFDSVVSLPHTFEDVEEMWKTHISCGSKDTDAFYWEEIKGGRSYYFYGIMVFHLVLDSKGHYLFKLSGKIYRLLSFSAGNISDASVYPLRNLNPDQTKELFYVLRQYNRQCFRDIVIDIFGCCNDHVKCSDVGKCLHDDDRFYNGCQYRSNLESGRIFYGKNRNVE